MSADDGKLVRVATQGDFYFISLPNGTMLYSMAFASNQENAKATCDSINTAAEAWHRERVQPLVNGLEDIIKHMEFIAGSGMKPRSVVGAISEKALTEYRKEAGQ